METFVSLVTSRSALPPGNYVWDAKVTPKAATLAKLVEG
jgi:hypothetical protein